MTFIKEDAERVFYNLFFQIYFNRVSVFSLFNFPTCKNT